LGTAELDRARLLLALTPMAHLVAILALSLATAGAPSRGHPSDPVGTKRARIVAAARRHIGKPFHGDCSGFVRRVYGEAGVALTLTVNGSTASESIFRSLARVRRPRRGDLAFFHRTYDREAPGPGRNRFTHVALVESVHGPRVSLIHRGGAGVRRFTMNLARPADPEENGALRRKRPGDRRGQRYLASELLAGFASAFRGEMRAGRSGPQRSARASPP